MGSFFNGLSWVFPRLLDHSVEISILICLIFLVKFLAPKKLPPWWHYSLWLLILVRMLVPLEFENRLNLFSFVPAVETPHVSELISSPPPELEMTVQPAVSQHQDAEADLRFAAEKIIPVVWLTGAMVLGVCILFESISFWRIVRRRPRVTDEAILSLLSECKRRMKIKRKIDIIVTDNVRCPALFGYLRPRLLLPERIFEKLNDRELVYAFMHELGHLKRHDIGVSWLIAVLQVIHWFNPLVWLAFYQIRIDQESACDASVLSRIKPKQSSDYAKAIVDFLEKFCHNCQLPALAGILENRSQMKKRIARIVQYRKSSQLFSIIAVALLATTGFVLFTFTGVAAEKESLAFSEPVVEAPRADSLKFIAEIRLVDTRSTSDGFQDRGASVPLNVVTESAAGLEGTREDSDISLPALSETTPPDEVSPLNRIDRNAGTDDGMEAMEKEDPPISLARLAIESPETGNDSEPVIGMDSISAEKPMPKPEVSIEPVSFEISEAADENMQTNIPDAAARMIPSQMKPRNEEIPASTTMLSTMDGLVAALDIKLSSAPDVDPGPAAAISIFQEDQESISMGQTHTDAAIIKTDQHAVAAEIEMLKETGKSLLQQKAAKASRTASHKHEESLDTGTFLATDVDTPPQVIKGYPPRYPNLAKREDITGSIVLQFVVTKDGNAVDTKVLASEPKGIFDESALKAIEQYRFKPGIKDGEAVDVKVNLPFKFDLT